MKDNASAAIAVRIHERCDGYIDVGLAQRRDDQVTLPAAIGLLAPMLHRAATANPEMAADRLNPQFTRLLHIHKTPAVGVTWLGIDFDGFSRQGPGNVNRPLGAVGYSVAVLTEAVDQN